MLENQIILKVPADEMQELFTRILLKYGFTNLRALECASIFTDSSLDGIYTHGVNRFPRFIQYVKEGYVDPNATQSLENKFGGIQQWNGNLGPGITNAIHATDQAMKIAKEHGIGCVALRNTNHWMRGGTYGWQAAEAGVIGMCWTNTTPNVPPWGGAEPAIGNNPLVIAVPRAKGHVVLDMAMSQFSYGALESYRKRGELLPVEGGF